MVKSEGLNNHIVLWFYGVADQRLVFFLFFVEMWHGLFWTKTNLAHARMLQSRQDHGSALQLNGRTG